MNVSLKGKVSNFGGYKVISSFCNPLSIFSPGMAWFDANEKPTIFLFEDGLSKKELQYLLAHEAAHIVNGDLSGPSVDYEKLRKLGSEGYLSEILNDPNLQKNVEERKESILIKELAADKTAYEVFGYDKKAACDMLEFYSLTTLGYMHEHIVIRSNAIKGL